MNNDETLVLHHTQGYQPDLTVVLAIIDARENVTLEYLCRIKQIDTALADDLFTLALIPFEDHLRSHS